jgi:cysteine sulfinate desulfinase/cysteine desulfurase-like protein
MGYDSEQARGLLRVSLGRFNTQQEVDRFLEILSRAVATMNGAAMKRRPPLVDLREAAVV